MRKTKRLIRELYALQAGEELYIVLTLVKLAAFACGFGAGVAVGYYWL
jgi:hypothetical protein